MLNKPTIVINPTRYDFKRELNYKGALKTKSVEELNKTIKDVLLKDNKELEELAPIRKKIIKDIICFSDGKNHKRIAIKIDAFMQSISNQKINTHNIPIKLTIKHILDYKKQKSALYQWYNPYVIEVYKQNDKQNFDEVFKKYEKVISE